MWPILLQAIRFAGSLALGSTFERWFGDDTVNQPIIKPDGSFNIAKIIVLTIAAGVAGWIISKIYGKKK